jgi:uncharacterized protein YecA (UPF0149 family)
MKKYSKVYLVKGEKHFGYRYNFENCVLEYVSKYDYRKVDRKFKDVILEDWEVVTSTGLDKEDWNEAPQYWVDYYMSEIAEETAHIAKYI